MGSGVGRGICFSMGFGVVRMARSAIEGIVGSGLGKAAGGSGFATLTAIADEMAFSIACLTAVLSLKRTSRFVGCTFTST